MTVPLKGNLQSARPLMTTGFLPQQGSLVLPLKTTRLFQKLVAQALVLSETRLSTPTPERQRRKGAQKKRLLTLLAGAKLALEQSLTARPLKKCRRQLTR